MNIEVVHKDLIDNYTIVNHVNNENHYIVYDDINNEKTIEYILLNINIYDYIKDDYINKDICNYINSHYINGFFYFENFYSQDEINEFLSKYSKYFSSQLKIDLIKIFDNVLEKSTRMIDLFQ